jgi:hypothetical protein
MKRSEQAAELARIRMLEREQIAKLPAERKTNSDYKTFSFHLEL